jgi:excisionase family DNA binding protein
MGARRINPNHVKLHRTYTIRELADRLGVHKNTVRQWQQQGLGPIDGGRPILFLGVAVRDFLAQRNASRRNPCGPGLFYCFRCREPRSPGGGMVDFLPLTALSGNLRAICECCGTLMHRRCSADAIPTVMPGISVQVVQAP